MGFLTLLRSIWIVFFQAFTRPHCSISDINTAGGKWQNNNDNFVCDILDYFLKVSSNRLSLVYLHICYCQFPLEKCWFYGLIVNLYKLSAFFLFCQSRLDQLPPNRTFTCWTFYSERKGKKIVVYLSRGTYLLLETKHQFLRQLETSGIGNLFSLRLWKSKAKYII